MSEPEPAQAPPVPRSGPPAPEQNPGWAVPDAMTPTMPPPLTAAPQPGPPLYGQGYSGHAAPGTPLPEADPAAQKRKRKRTLWTVTAVVAALVLAAAGVLALTPGRTGDSAVAKVQCQPSRLATCLIKAPAGAVLLNPANPWSRQPAPSADLYAANITNDAKGMNSDTSTLLAQDGLRQIAHIDWNAVDGNDIDLVLLDFGTQKGAQAWNSTRTAEILAAYPGHAVAIPADLTAKAFAAPTADARGNVNAAYSTVVGNLVLNVAYSSPKLLGAQDLESWAGTEVASLRTAPAAPADPPDVAPGTGQFACGTRLSSCLMPKPSGSQSWDAPYNGDWVSGSALTVNQFVKLDWADTSTQASVSSHFTSNAVTAIVHEDWTLDNGNKQADIYLIQTLTDVGAVQLNGSNFGEPTWGPGQSGVSFTIPGEPQAEAWYTAKTDPHGFIDYYFTARIGNVIVSGWSYFYGSFDAGTAASWSQSELNLVGGSLSSRPLGLFPLTAPTPPASTQRACPASGDCLLPPPAGATDTTAGSYYVQESLSPLDYTAKYDGGLGSEAATWLNADGFQSAKHRSWTTADGATADAVLLKYGKPAQARAAALLEYGDNVSDNRICPDSAIPDSLCLASRVSAGDPLQEETVWVLAWKGDYEVGISLTRSGSADLAGAYASARQQLDMLPAD